jgi:hypothetical protein
MRMMRRLRKPSLIFPHTSSTKEMMRMFIIRRIILP